MVYLQARDNKCDVFNCLDLLDNKKFLEPLKFGIGDGKLQYYLYNWQCPQVRSSNVQQCCLYAANANR